MQCPENSAITAPEIGYDSRSRNVREQRRKRGGEEVAMPGAVLGQIHCSMPRSRAAETTPGHAPNGIAPRGRGSAITGGSRPRAKEAGAAALPTPDPDLPRRNRPS